MRGLEQCAEPFKVSRPQRRDGFEHPLVFRNAMAYPLQDAFIRHQPRNVI